MTIAEPQLRGRRATPARPIPSFGHNRPGRSAYLYAIAFDLDTDQLKESDSAPSWQNAYFDLRRELEGRGFRWTRGSVYFGEDHIRSKDCIKAVMDLDATLPLVQALRQRHPHAADYRGGYPHGLPRI